jgi:hypothetical protein
MLELVMQWGLENISSDKITAVLCKIRLGDSGGMFKFIRNSSCSKFKEQKIHPNKLIANKGVV